MEVAEQLVAMPRIGDKAPEFKAITTQGEINFPFDYNGKWVILLVTRQTLHRCAHLNL